jgi:hypothetical protein
VKGNVCSSLNKKLHWVAPQPQKMNWERKNRPCIVKKVSPNDKKVTLDRVFFAPFWPSRNVKKSFHPLNTAFHAKNNTVY